MKIYEKSSENGTSTLLPFKIFPFILLLYLFTEKRNRLYRKDGRKIELRGGRVRGPPPPLLSLPLRLLSLVSFVILKSQSFLEFLQFWYTGLDRCTSLGPCTDTPVSSVLSGLPSWKSLSYSHLGKVPIFTSLVSWGTLRPGFSSRSLNLSNCIGPPVTPYFLSSTPFESPASLVFSDFGSSDRRRTGGR